MIMSLKTSIAVVLAACFTMFSASALAAEPQIDAQAACVIDSTTGNELYAKNEITDYLPLSFIVAGVLPRWNT